MLLSEAAQYIKTNVPTESVLRLYGYIPNASGFIRCPFHGDKTASLKIYDHGKQRASSRGWYCFGCHAGGSVLDFVMRHDSCDFATAVRAVDASLFLDLLSVEPWIEQEKYRTLQRWLDLAQSRLLYLAEVEQKLLNGEIAAKYHLWQKVDQIPRPARTAEQWTYWYTGREELYALEDRLSRLEEYKEEVRRWRNSHRFRKRTA